MYEHILEAEKILKRVLGEFEVVHHIDGNRENNTLNNLMVFRSNGEHLRYHSGTYDKLYKENNVWICTEKTYHCTNCGNIISRNGEMCISCYIVTKKNKNKPSKEQLYSDLLDNSFTFVGKKYKVSDNGIRKWCDSYNIPRDSKYYRKGGVKC